MVSEYFLYSYVLKIRFVDNGYCFSHRSFLLYMLSLSVSLRITLQGLPAAKQPAGISRVTTEPAPITEPLPIVTPPQITTFEAIQQSDSITMGRAYSRSVNIPRSLIYILRSAGNSGCTGVAIVTLGPKKTLSPIVTGAQSSTVKLKLA